MQSAANISLHLSIEYTFLSTEIRNRLTAQSVYIMKIPTSKPRKERNRSRRAIKLVGGTTGFFVPETSPLSFLPGGHLIPNQRFIWSAVELPRYLCHVITNVV